MAASYLGRLRERTAWLALKRQIVLGLVGGWLLLLIGGFRYYYALHATKPASIALLAAGGVLFGMGLLWPQGLAPVERGVRAGTGWIGKTILMAFLSLTYFVVITPVGFVWRATRGTHPFYTWKTVPPSGMEGWVPKSVVDDARDASAEAGVRRLATQPFFVIGYFVRNGHFMLLPVVVFLLIAGLVLYFVKSSALAPFIYTLF